MYKIRTSKNSGSKFFLTHLPLENMIDRVVNWRPTVVATCQKDD